MSRPGSLLNQLDALDALAEAKFPAPKEPPPPEPAPVAAPKAPAGQPSAIDIYAMLKDLKRDIAVLQREQQHSAPPPLTQDQQLYAVLNELRRDIANLQGEQHRESREAAMPAQERHLYGLLAELKRDVEVLRREQDAQSLPPAERQLYAMLAELKSDIRSLQEGHDHDVSGSRVQLPARWTPQAAGPAAAQGSGRLGNIPAVWLLALLPLAIIGGYLASNLDRTGNRFLSVSSTPAIEAKPIVAAGTPLYEALAAGPVSPRGTSAAGVSDMRALSRASRLLADPARDTDEAAFWLKRYLQTAMGDRQLVRALTQLGSSYADATSKSADYVKARHLWEIASVAGDPVAMCFLGRLFESGMGVQASKRTALAWYERAKASGGCTDVDEAIGRLQR